MPANRTAQLRTQLGVLDKSYERFSLSESFEQRPALNGDILITSTAPTLAQMAAIFAANRSFEVKGTNMTGALCTHATSGGITLTTAGASADQAILVPHADSGQSAWATTDWSTDDEVSFGAKLVTGASIADQHLWTGLMLTSPATFDTGDDDDKVLLYYNPSVNDGKWQFLYSVGGTDYTQDTGVEVEASTAYEIQIDIDSDRIARAYINEAHVATAENALTTAKDLIPTTGIEATAAAAKSVTILPPYAIAKTPNA